MNFSKPLGIAAVSYMLKELLIEGLTNRKITLSNKVSVLPPDKINTIDEENQLNLFMYMATPNQGWSNQMHPSRDSKGALINNPPLALDLHYLLTAYGSSELFHDIMLGFGMIVLHDNPVLSKEFITTSFDNLPGSGAPNEVKELADSGLAEQIEFIKISPEILNTEEISRLWAAFGSKYRPTAAYKVTVVLLQSEKSVKSALPVRQRNLYVLPFHQPVIEKITSSETENGSILENKKILANHWLVIQGHLLKAELVSVQIGGDSIVPAPEHISENQITIQLPNNLKAGMHLVQIVHQIYMGSPSQPHKGVHSNAAVFFLSPSFNDTLVVTPDGGAGKFKITLNNIKPTIYLGQKVELLLNQINTLPAAIPKVYQFKVPKDNLPNAGTVSTLVIPVTDVSPGEYLVRLKVDNAESALNFDAVVGFNKPKITIP
jgi:hypothetical protein